MYLYHYIRKKILQNLQSLQEAEKLPRDLSLERIALETPKDPSHGDFSTNAAMVLAKQSHVSPRELAEWLCVPLRQDPDIVEAVVAGPGFINIKIHAHVWRQQLARVIEQGAAYGRSSLGEGVRINVEFVSANPTGPMHAGHGRNAVFGDAVAALLEAIGYDVTREYYINDAGSQMDTVARSVYWRYLQVLGHDIPETQFEGLYPGEYLIDTARKLVENHQETFVDEPEAVWLPVFRAFALKHMMQCIQEDLSALGVVMDVYTSEKELVHRGVVEQGIERLEHLGCLYHGLLEKPKGHEVDDWEPRPQTLFRSTHYGDDVDRPIKKSDGSWTYFASDIAYHYDKFQRGYLQMINIFGADHIGYIKRLKAATTAITEGQATLEIQATQLVNFLDRGVPVRMSKRAGTFIPLRDVIDRVGKDVTRFIMLTRHQDMPIDFDFAKVSEQTKDNPVFYVQYAHARTQSVLRHACRAGLWSMEEAPSVSQSLLDLLTDPHELTMIQVLAMYPRELEVAASAREPHRLAAYLYHVAATFHALWNKGKEHVQLRFIDESQPDLTRARLILLCAVAQIISNGLMLFNIQPVEEMQ